MKVVAGVLVLELPFEDDPHFERFANRTSKIIGLRSIEVVDPFPLVRISGDPGAADLSLDYLESPSDLANGAFQIPVIVIYPLIRYLWMVLDDVGS
jgi:hypothetical protein